MDKEKIDFLKNLANENPTTLAHSERRWRFGVAKTLFSVLILALIFTLSYAKDVLVAGNNLAAQFGNSSFFSTLKYLVGADDKKIAGEGENRINILLLGIGGANHPGGQLTDTIMLASIRPSDGAAALLSIPRDLAAPIPGVGWKKINFAQAYGRAQGGSAKGAGPKLAARTLETVTGLPIHYYIKLDFTGFKQIVDALGGVRINVPEAFTDNEYPNQGFGFAPISFVAGWQNFNGGEALAYARSRHGNNKQGSDFARARRQQALLAAFQTKLLSLSTFLQPQKIAKAIQALSEHLETDLDIWQVLRLAALAKKIETGKIRQLTLSNAPDGLLASEIGPDGAYLLRPRLGSENFSEIKSVAINLLSENPYVDIANSSGVEKPAAAAPEPAAAKNAAKKKEIIRVAVQNGTPYPGLAARTAAVLAKLSFQVVAVSNAPRRDFETTVIFDISKGEHREAMEELQRELKATVAPALPASLTAPNADFLIIVGADNIPKGSLSTSAALDYLFHLL